MTRSVRALLALLVAPALSAGEVQLKIDGGNAALDKREMILDGEFAGFVGDTIVLSKPKHQLGILLPQGFYAYQQLRIENGALTAVSSPGGECVGKTSWTLKDWPAPLVKGSGASFELQLRAASPKADGECSNLPSNLTCIEVSANLDVHANPEVHAEIWIDGKSANASTAIAVSVPFCQGTMPRKTVVLRAPGYSNCQSTLRLAVSKDSFPVVCTLMKLVPTKP